MDMLIGGIFTRILTIIREFCFSWNQKVLEKKDAVIDMESWLEHKMDKLWETEENQVLLHYEKLN